ncbi:MAG: NRDE family protein [Bacteroidota bacterium]
MCLIAFNWQNHPRYKLILIANRDEYFHRATAPAAYWEDDPNLLAGRDLEAGGTWMGIHRRGAFTALTNYRDPQQIKSKAPSRGHLTSEFLKGNQTPLAYLKEIEPLISDYNGFNLLVGNLEELYYCSNYAKDLQKLQPGLYGLSNHLLDSPWPKVTKAKRILEGFLNQDVMPVSDLLEAMHDSQFPPDKEVQQTGLPFEIEKQLSRMFISMPQTNYGTHSSSVLLLDKENRFFFTERRYPPKVEKLEERTFEMK